MTTSQYLSTAIRKPYADRMAELATTRASAFYDPRLPAKLGWKIWRRGNVGALVFAAVTLLVTVLAAPIYLGDVPLSSLFSFLLVAPPAFFTLGSAIGAGLSHFYARRAVGWMREGREPSAAEIKRMAAVPRIEAFIFMGLWYSSTHSLTPS